MLEKLCFYAFTFLLPSFLLGQSYLGKVQHFGIEEGLSHRDVQCTHQDQSGMIWFGTKYGLNRFDGVNFKWYTAETHGLQHNEINFILEDKKGLLWLMHTSAFMYTIPYGISIFDPRTEEVSSFENYFDEKAPLEFSDILNFSRTGDGDLLFFTKQHQLIAYDGTFKVTPIPQEDFHKLQAIKKGPNDWVWLILQKQIENQNSVDESILLLAFDAAGKEVNRIEHPAYSYGYIYALEKDGTCRYLISSDAHSKTDAFISKADKTTIPDQSTQILLQQSGFDKSCLFPYQPIALFKDFLWISGSNETLDNTSLKTLDLKGGQNIQWDRTHKNISHLTALFLDNRGEIWASSQFGVFHISFKENYFSKVLHHENGQNLPTRGMAIDRSNNLWVVDESIQDFWKVNLNTGHSALFFSPNTTLEGHVPNYYFVSLAHGKKNQFYYSNHIYLIEFDPVGNDIKRHQIGEEGDAWNGIWTIYEDEYGTIWYAAGSSKIGYWDGTKSTWLPPIDTGRYVTYTYQFFKDRKGVNWMVTDGGLFTLDIENKKILDHYWAGGEGEFHLPFDKLYHVHEDKDGSFWMGTSGSGLVHWKNPGAGGAFSQFTQAHGLSNNNIYAVYEDDFGNLWLPSDYGIMRFNKSTHQCHAFLEEDGITHNEFNRISHYKAEDGKIYFGGLNGVSAFAPKDFQAADDEILETPLVVTDYQHYDGAGEFLLEKKLDLLENHNIVLHPNDRFFRIEFALLTYRDVEKNQYAFKVEGVDDDWTYQKENAIRFSRLPYGEHTLRIKGQAFNGRWSQNELAINLTVLIPFYLQTWFLVLIGIAVFGGAFIYYKWRVNSLKARQRELENIVSERTKELREDKQTIESQNQVLEEQAVELKSLEQLKSRFFANVSHELRTPLTLMLGPINKLEKGNLPKEKANQLIRFLKNNSTHLLKLVNEILDLSKLETNRLEIKETDINFHYFLQPLLAQYKSASNSESLNLEIQYNADKDLNISLDIGKFEKIVHNFLSNAIKFTPEKGTVTLIVEDLQDQLLVKVSDTGVGIHPNDMPHIFDRFYQSKQPEAPVQGGTGIGLSLCKELAELLDGHVWAESELGKGSVFYFQFPKKVSELQVAGSRLLVESSEVSKETEDVKIQEMQEIEAISVVEPSQEATSNSQLTSILIVEDNPELREYLEVLLSDDYNIITAENGKVGYECLIKNEDCQLIISDLMMPVMDGFQFLEKVKSHDAFRHIPFIMLTARADVKVKLRALRIGVDDYLTKPFVEEELTTRIENLLRNLRERMADAASNGAAKENRPIMPQVDVEWLEEVESVFNKYLSDSSFTLELAASKVNLSLRQFQRRIKKVTGLAGHQYLLEMRLNKTKDFLEWGKYATIKEVAYAVGFRQTRHFSTTFKKRFGVLPSQYITK